MSPTTGQPPGTGSALMRLMQLRQQGATPNAVQNPGSTAYVPPAASPTTNAINPSQISAAGQQQPPQPVQGPPGMGSQAATPVNPNIAIDPHSEALQTAMGALSNYIAGHAKSLQADHGVQEKEARAKLISSQAQPASGSPVGA